MLLTGRHGTTKHVVRSLVLQRKRSISLHCCYITTSCRLTERLSSSENSASPEKSYAVLGGGVTGLSAAYFLTCKFPDAKVTIYERTRRLGGWVDSETVDVDGGKVLFEWGPRTLRPDMGGPGKITIQLLHELGLAGDIVATHQDHPAARNRFIYYPDHLVRMPAPYAHAGLLSNLFSNTRTILAEPIFKGMIGALLSEPTVKCRERHVQDESVGDFMSRRFGSTIADNLMSALFHGIYAGDIYNLSARTLLSKLWFLETRDPEGGGILPELFEIGLKRERLYSRNDATTLFAKNPFMPLDEPPSELFNSLSLNMARQAVYTFTRGIGQLTQQLEHRLRQNPNVYIVDETPIDRIFRDADSGNIAVSAVEAIGKDILKPNTVTSTYSHVISTVSPSLMLNGDPKIDGSGTAATSITEAATVMVVNLYYANPNLTEPYRGFGYLIPQSIPMDQNPERALGVIFASETSGPCGPSPGSPSGDLPTRWSTNHQDTAPGTKLTVMLGGHWWTNWSADDIPSPETAIEMAKSILARHLHITETPLLAKARLQEDAIPQYRVGHRDAMAHMHSDMQRYRGRVRVAGPAWQGGVGLNDCIRTAWAVVEDLALDDDALGDGSWKTGIEDFAKEEEWVVVGPKETRDGKAGE